MNKDMIEKNKIWLYSVLLLLFAICAIGNYSYAQEDTDMIRTLGKSSISYYDSVKSIKSYSYQTKSGSVATGMISNLSNGMCEYTVSYEKKNEGTGKEYVEFYLDGKKLDCVDVSVDENNISSATIKVETMNNSVLTATLFCGGKTLIKDLKFNYCYIEEYEVEGKGYEEELENIKYYMDIFGTEKNVHLVSLQNAINLDTKTDYLKDLLDCNVVDIWDETNLEENINKSGKHDYVLLKNPNKNKLIFDVVEKYDIIYVSSNYTLLVYRSEETTQKEIDNNIFVYNKSNKVNTDYFGYFADLGFVLSDVSLSLPSGCYEIEADGSTLEPSCTTTFSIIRYGSYNYQTDICIGAGDTIKRNFISDGKTSVVFNCIDYDPDCKGSLFISKLDRLQEGDIVELSSNGTNSFYCDGFYPPDDEGAWTTGKSIDMRLPVETGKNIKLAICMKSVEAQSVEIYLNDELQKNIEVDNRFSEYTVDVPESLIDDEVVKISLKFKKSFSLPKEVQIENKNNLSKAGLKIKSIRFE